MKAVKSLAVLSTLFLGGLTGCGGVENAEAPDEGTVGTEEQALCSLPPPHGDCTGPVLGEYIPSCNHYGYTFSYVCQVSNSCWLYQCGTGWKKRIGYDCATTVKTFCP
jgi:hypothetical protein